MNLARGFLTVGGATMASRVLGFAREMLIAMLLGTGPVADVFYAAFRFPNLFRRLFAEGAFNTAFVPLFAKELEGGGPVAARAFAEQVLGVFLLVLVALTALAEIAMPGLVATIIAPGFDGEGGKHDLTVEFARIMFPYLMFMSLVAMLSGVLNSFRRYAAAAFAPVLLNIIMIAILLGCYAAGYGDSPKTGRWMAWGVTVSGIAQLALLAIAVRRLDFAILPRRPRLTPSVRRLLVLAVPAAIAGGITQVNLLIGQIIASQKAGAIAILQYADRVYQLPLGVVGIAVGVVLLPELSRRLKAEDWDAATDTQNQSLEFSLLLTLPAAIGIAVLAEPILALLYQRGAFGADDTAATADALIAFAVGLPAFVMIKVFSPGFFAREDMRTPMIYAGIGVAVNIAGSLILFPVLFHVGIAIATAAAGWVNALLLLGTLVRRGWWTWRDGLIRRLALMLAAACLMGAVLFGAQTFAGIDAASAILRAVALLVLITLGAGIYFAGCHLSRAFNLRRLAGLLRRKTDNAQS